LLLSQPEKAFSSDVCQEARRDPVSSASQALSEHPTAEKLLQMALVLALKLVRWHRQDACWPGESLYGAQHVQY
jgi:hypothetical protein